MWEIRMVTKAICHCIITRHAMIQILHAILHFFVVEQLQPGIYEISRDSLVFQASFLQITLIVYLNATFRNKY